MIRLCVRYFVYIVLVSFVGISGCARPPKYPPPLRLDLKSLDLTALQGRKIVIDPGHGGRFVGAVGTKGLRESDINLAVGLHLWGFLKQAGVEVWMTRTADVDLASPVQPNVADDLEARSQLSNQLNPEIFLSIHHNSNTKDPEKNDTELYYKLADSGPSQDLANCVAEAFRTGAPASKVYVFPGNYRVLRTTGAVAILGEASFISNRENENRLSFSGQLRREAEDYFLGILAYFQKGVPEVRSYQPDGATIDDAFPEIEATIVGGPDGHAINPETTKLLLDGIQVPATFDLTSGKLSFTPDKPLAGGMHTVVAEARNNNGNMVGKKAARFGVSLAPAAITLHSAFSSLPANGASTTRIEVTALDRHGNPVIDGTSIAITASPGSLETGTIRTVSGKSSTYFTAPRTAGVVTIEAQAQGVTGKATITCGSISSCLLRLRVVDNGDKPLDAVTVAGSSGLEWITDQGGSAFITTNQAGELSLTLKRPGYIVKETRVLLKRGEYREEKFLLAPREDGVLLGEKMIIDPEPYDEHTEKEFGMTAESEKANLQVAEDLRLLLEEAGAITTLTTPSPDYKPSPSERVLRGEEFGGEYFITITHRRDDPYVAHYFRSQRGKMLANAVAQGLSQRIKLETIRVQEGADYTITQPSPPSIVVNVGNNYLSGGEQKQEEFCKREAQGIYEGIVKFLKGFQARGSVS